MPKKIYWIIGLLLFVCVDVSAGIESEDKQAFHNLIAKYMEYFNSRNPDGILSMYSDDAMIKTKIKGKEKFVTKEEFMAKLPDDIKEWENKKQNLCGRSTIDFKRKEN